jgi:hypothetical protein
MYTPFTPMVAAVQPSLLWSLQRHTLLRLWTVTTALQNAKLDASLVQQVRHRYWRRHVYPYAYGYDPYG